MNELSDVGVVILAAGESSRMKSPKPFLKYDTNRRFIDKIIDEYRDFGINHIVVVVNKSTIKELNLDNNTLVCVNEHLEYERFYSIKLGLEKIGKCDFCFIQNIDNPFVNKSVLNKLYENKSKNGGIIPVIQDKGGHPVLLGSEVISYIVRTKELNLNFKEVINEFPGNRVEVADNSILININSLEEYQKYFK
ncbi:MAG: hypothetical protein A2X61_03865 [Ignavibacteria bacterium GWB2_35_12]|nr:MAG: hypothetical protein A2X61_03865 [Ignavibacteria bacterium GWB2_35_12]OGU92214.1 MAG: hypothetical protein A2220_13805 [Ignavibacteria bacterium RIFOXYA2_FULL_35_10]OGV22558.1 MAG: hypothetical protein A2475_03540 [Ignavibacteria bacterium RIFOXYC2_FULL_35_21]